MKDFIGNPFDQEFENEDDVDELDLGDGQFLFQNATNPIIIGPPYHVEEEEDEDIFAVDDEDIEDDDDPDYDYFQDNDGYDSNAEHLEFSSDGDEDEGDVDDVPRYNLRFSSDEEEEELDYVTFPVDDPPEAPIKPTAQEPSNASSSDQESECHSEET